MDSTTAPERDGVMTPLRLAGHDWLGIRLGHDGKFELRPRSLTQDARYRMVGSDTRSVINGEEWHDSWLQSSREVAELWDRLPECSWSANREVHVACATDFTCITIARSWPAERIAFANSETSDLFHALLAKFEEGKDAAVIAAKFKADRTVPQLPEGWTERKEAELADYQRVAAFLATKREGFSLFMDMGTGKTASAIQVINEEARLMKAGLLEGGVVKPDGSRMLRVLVVCPGQVRLNWQRELEKFATMRGKVLVLRGGKTKRIHRVARLIGAEDGLDFAVGIISYDSMVRSIDVLSMIQWDRVITDESHSFKDSRTNRFDAAKQLRDIASRRRLNLTGSPIGNTPMDLWSQLEFAQKGSSGFEYYKTFKQFHGVFEQINTGAGHGVAKLIGLKNIPFLQERLARMSFAVSKNEAGLKLPEKVRSVVEVSMTAYQSEVYARLQDELALEIEDQMSGEVVDEVTVQNVLTRLLRLAQVTSGYITYDPKRDENNVVTQPGRTAELSSTNPKVDALVELIQDPERDPRGKTVVWCTFVQNIRRISEELTKLGIVHGCYYGATSAEDRDALVDKFNCDPKFKVLICNPQTAGAGLNLLGYDTRNPEASDTFCDMEVFFSSDWSSLKRVQAEDRAHRRGTRTSVQVIDLVVPSTIDEEIIDRVTAKREMATTVVDLRETLRRVLGQQMETAEVD